MDDSSYVLMLFAKYSEQCYSDFLLSNNPFVESAKRVMNKTSSRADLKTFMQDILSVTVTNMLKMAFVYQGEMFKNGALNEALPEEKNLLSDIKTKVASQNKTINNTQLYKLIREALVHSDTEHPNFQATGIDEFVLKLKPKGQKEIRLVLNNNDMLKIISVFNLNIEKAMYYTEIKEIDLQNAIDNSSLTKENVSDYISVSEYGEPVAFDDYQREALINYFYSNNDIMKARYGIGSAYGEALMSRIPFKSNPYNLYTDYMKVVYYFMTLSRNASKDVFNVEKTFYDYNKNNNVPPREFLTINPNIDINYNILLAAFACLATTISKAELTKILNNAGIKIDEDTANHLRNSLAHGRYFINLKNNISVEFYDGKSLAELSHFLTLSIKDINNAMVTQIYNYDKTLTTQSEQQKN